MKHGDAATAAVRQQSPIYIARLGRVVAAGATQHFAADPHSVQIGMTYALSTAGNNLVRCPAGEDNVADVEAIKAQMWWSRRTWTLSRLERCPNFQDEPVSKGTGGKGRRVLS